MRKGIDEFVSKLQRSRIGMRLEDNEQAVVRNAESGLQSCRDLGRMVCVVVNNGNAVPYALLFKAAV